MSSFLQQFRLFTTATKTSIIPAFSLAGSLVPGKITLPNLQKPSCFINIVRNFARNPVLFPLSGKMTPSPSPTSSPSKRSSVGATLQKSPSPLKNSPKKLKFDENSKVLAEIQNSSEVIESISKLEKIKVQEEGDMLFFKKMSDKAFAPMKGSKLAAGYDLQSAYKYTVPARGHCLLKTDIQIKLPRGTYGRVAPRSGLALKHRIDVGAGVIDEDYRGNVGVILFNHGDVDFEVNEGDRVAQLICEKISYPDIMEVDNLDETDRGAGGFGSTGVSVKA